LFRRKTVILRRNKVNIRRIAAFHSEFLWLAT
jgi:hypothetical protein